MIRDNSVRNMVSEIQHNTSDSKINLRNVTSKVLPLSTANPDHSTKNGPKMVKPTNPNVAILDFPLKYPYLSQYKLNLY